MSREVEAPKDGRAARTPADFDRLYAGNPDPFDYRESWYERRKRYVTVASLPRRRYGRCYEPGCSIGELTKLLAGRCDELLAIDCAKAAVQQARAATVGLGHVRVEQAVLPDQLPDGSFDLIVLSEVLSYLADGDVRALLEAMMPRLGIGGDIVAVTARPQPRWENAKKHRFLSARSELTRLVHHEDEDFILDVFRRASSSQRAAGPAPTAAGVSNPNGVMVT